MPPQSPPLEYLYARRWRIWGVVMIGRDTTQVERAAFFNPQDPSAGTQLAPRTPLEHKARLIVDEHVRNAYGDAIGVAAFVTLLGIPFSLTMRRRPGEAASPEMVAAAAAAAG
jgi:hypothetical protein